jgi:hypothetical protein
MQTIIGILGNLSYLVINFKIKLIINIILILTTILHISKARILRVIFLFFVEF